MRWTNICRVNSLNPKFKSNLFRVCLKDELVSSSLDLDTPLAPQFTVTGQPTFFLCFDFEAGLLCVALSMYGINSVD